VLSLGCLMAVAGASAQTTAGPTNPNAPVTTPKGGVVVADPVLTVPMATLPLPVSAAIQSATTLAREPLMIAVDRALPMGVVSASQLMLAAASLPSVSAASPMLVAPVRSVAPLSPALLPALSPSLVPSVATMVKPAPSLVTPAVVVPATPHVASPAVQPVTVGAPVGEGVRVMRAPAACTPKTNSLDCVQDSSEGAQGANVAGRVRNSIIGEVGAGKATTEGAGGAQRQQACTPKLGELSCSN
jgi:hypothetical protein